ncbi:hypothetical protein [Neopusillimonas aromaticivorans]|uniref:hypothetical protein n=1 Tax=Neopusillimonas aromaticivorans TaxID=2979868 RepID=UPI0025988B30|nr:hypothetical protein [Neopusillimonas aromaticivorans]WJJ93766.1 hypothetical protein N7E01_00355 [Neopusillimonas aromaticivorans]
MKDKIYELGRTDTSSLNPRKLKEWVSWANDIERSFDAIEESLAEALRFFSKDNLLLVHKLDAIETQRN